MPARPVGEAADRPRAPAFWARFLVMLWPAFIITAAVEGCVVVLVDPADPRWLDGAFADWSRIDLCSAVFLPIWMLIALCCAATIFVSDPT